MFYVQAGEIGPDHRHHPFDGNTTHVVKPFGFRPPEQMTAIFFRERSADAFQIVAGIKTLGISPISSPSASW